MKFSERWLREWVAIDLETEALVEQLTMAGLEVCLLYTSPSPRDLSTSRMPSSA